MANAMHDDNGMPTLIGISCIDGITPIKIKRDPTTGGIKVDAVTIISVVPVYTTQVDDNNVPISKGVSSSDANVILPLYVVPSTGAVLIDT